MLGRRVRGLLSDTRLRRLSWTFMNQGVVSAATFVLQIALARHLPAADYGVFVLVFGGLLTLQICTLTLVFHPMSVRVSAAPLEKRPQLLGASLILVVILSIALGAVLSVAIAIFGRPDLIAPALLFFLAWQLQEGLRRGLLSSFRHGAAIAGDTTTYGGQALLIIGLGTVGWLTVDGAFYAMGASAGLGAMMHGRLQPLAWPKLASLRSILRDYWSIGGGAALSNGYLSLFRIMVVPWALAAFSGSAAAAGFQAAMNIVNLSNPLILGLGNIIPQAAASAGHRGNAEAWRAARGYAMIAAPPIMVYSAGVLALPTFVLRLFYGSGSAYVHLDMVVQLLILVGLTGFFIEVVISFLHGIASVRNAVTINAAGTAASIFLAVPLIYLFGLIGGCVALLLANVVRLVLSRVIIARVTASPLPGTA